MHDQLRPGYSKQVRGLQGTGSLGEGSAGRRPRIEK